MENLKLSELMSALSYALDITEGQPEGHCIRCCWIGMNIGRKIGLPAEQLWQLYYVLLLKDLGCSSNASRICELYLTDDLTFKREFKWVAACRKCCVLYCDIPEQVWELFPVSERLPIFLRTAMKLRRN